MLHRDEKNIILTWFKFKIKSFIFTFLVFRRRLQQKINLDNNGYPNKHTCYNKYIRAYTSNFKYHITE